MDHKVQEKLLHINRQFYDQFATGFSNTRDRIQPGTQKVSQRIAQNDSILDIGCGNGTLARALADQDFSGHYLGVDMSLNLLAEAKSLLGNPVNGDYAFQLVDLAAPNWLKDLPRGHYDWLVSFAVLHHIPGDDLRLGTALAFNQLIKPDGFVAVSVWQWHNSPRLRKRVQPWSTVGINLEALDEGDVLLDWRADKTVGLRYVHTFDEDSLANLAVKAGFMVSDSFYSDGKSGDLALYQIWQPNHAAKKPAK